MSWTLGQRRRYAPAISDTVRTNATVRLATMIDALAPPARTGRPRLWSTLAMLQALWWLCRAGSAWKLLPTLHPPRQTIGSRLERWVRLGVLDRALAVLNGCLRLARGRKRRPSAGILDTQSVKTGPQGGPRGFDAGKQVKGRKRVLLVDTEGLVQAIQVVPASLQDRDTPAVIEPALAASRLRKVWADLAFPPVYSLLRHHFADGKLQRGEGWTRRLRWAWARRSAPTTLAQTGPGPGTGAGCRRVASRTPCSACCAARTWSCCRASWA